MAAIHKRALPTVFAQNQVTSARDSSGEELRELRHDAFAIIQLTRYLADAVQFGAVKDLDTLARRRNRTSPMTWDRRGPSGGSRRTYSHDPNTEHSSAQTILTQLMRTMAHITCPAQLNLAGNQQIFHHPPTSCVVCTANLPVAYFQTRHSKVACAKERRTPGWALI